VLAVKRKALQLNASDAQPLAVLWPYRGRIVDRVVAASERHVEVEDDGPTCEALLQLVAEVIRTPVRRVVLGDRSVASIRNEVVTAVADGAIGVGAAR